MTYSRVFKGEIMHSRLSPKLHRFRYPIYFFAFDLDELELLDQTVSFFSYNRKNLVSFYDRDYLRGTGSVKEKLLRILYEEKGIHAQDLGRIEMVTCARYFHYVFNPVSFYYCYGVNGELTCVVAEVNNTFKERHLYILDGSKSYEQKGFLSSYTDEKSFHVSPFNDLMGVYHFHFSDIQQDAMIRVDLHKQGKLALATYMKGEASPLNTKELLKTLLTYPVSTLLTSFRISWQAAKLYFLKGLNIHMKPEPSSKMTFSTQKPSWRNQMSMRIIFNFMSKIQIGYVIFKLPDGEIRSFGDEGSALRAEIHVHRYDFFRRVIRGADIGFGEAYTAGDWDTDDLTNLLQIFVENASYMNERNIVLSWLGTGINRIQHLFRKNSLSGSRKNIQAHYDLSNALYAEFLDRTMTYSCALFENKEDTVEQAQLQKLHTMVRKAQITSEDHVLEIGSGWGSFSIEAVRQTGCRVTTVTLSDEQYALARERIREVGLEDRIEVKLCDYRKLTGTYDKIVSIEMFEAVGHEFYGVFFKTLDRLLKPNGLVAMQVITIEDQRYENYRKSVDWIQKYIFPGGTLPSLTAMSSAMTKHSSFIVEDMQNIGIHYARTLREWRKTFMTRWPAIEQLGFDEAFKRTWEYYMCYCEAGFNTRTLGTLQLVLTRPNNKQLPQEV